MPVVPVLADSHTFIVKIILNRRMTFRTSILWPCLTKTYYFLIIQSLVTFVGFTGRKSGPEQTRILPGFSLFITYVFLYF